MLSKPSSIRFLLLCFSCALLLPFCVNAQESGSNILSSGVAAERAAGAPFIKRHPRSKRMKAGTRLSIWVLAYWDKDTRTKKNLSYQWYKDDRPIRGANRSSLKVGKVTMETQGVYHVVVTNTAGQSTKSLSSQVRIWDNRWIGITIRSAVLRSPKPVGSTYLSICKVHIKPQSYRRELLKDAKYEFRVGEEVVALESKPKYVHILRIEDNRQSYGCTFIDSKGERRDSRNPVELLVE